MVGDSTTAAGKHHAFLWRSGRMIDLRGLGGDYTDVATIDDAGQVIGNSVPDGGSVVHAFAWQRGAIVDLGTLGGAESDAAAIDGRSRTACRAMDAAAARLVPV